MFRFSLEPTGHTEAEARRCMTSLSCLCEQGLAHCRRCKRRLADMVLLDADPLSDIANTRKIAGVVLRGHLFSEAELKAMKGH